MKIGIRIFFLISNKLTGARHLQRSASGRKGEVLTNGKGKSKDSFSRGQHNYNKNSSDRSSQKQIWRYYEIQWSPTPNIRL